MPVVFAGEGAQHGRHLEHDGCSERDVPADKSGHGILSFVVYRISRCKAARSAAAVGWR